MRGFRRWHPWSRHGYGEHVVEESTLYLVRHAKAGERARWNGDDQLRPLSGKGRRQAVAVCERLHPLVATAPQPVLVASPYIRCMQTLEPLAARLHTVVVPDERLMEGCDRQGTLDLIETLPHGSVLCSHGDVIPDVMAALERRAADITCEPDWRKGTVWVLSRQGSTVMSATVWPPPAID